jgi:hypothetical protein
MRMRCLSFRPRVSAPRRNGEAATAKRKLARSVRRPRGPQNRLPPKKETVGICQSCSASTCGWAGLPRRVCLRPDRETGRGSFFNIRLLQDSAMKSLQKEKRGTAAPPTDLDHPASRGGRSAHSGRPSARRKNLAGHPQRQRGETGEDWSIAGRPLGGSNQSPLEPRLPVTTGVVCPI